MSARNEDIDKIRGLDYGADDYMTKPFSPAELAARIKSHISRYDRLKGKTTAAEIISHKGLEINTAAHKVYVNGQEVMMTTKEYELLLFLATKPQHRIHKGAALRRDLGRGLLRRPRDRAGTYPEDPQKDRKRPLRAGIHRNALGHGLPVQRLKRAMNTFHIN